jgi:hypothetical protein
MPDAVDRRLEEMGIALPGAPALSRPMWGHLELPPLSLIATLSSPSIRI